MKILATMIEEPNAQNASFVNPYFKNNSKMSNAHSEPNVKSFFKYFLEEADTHSSSNVNTFSENNIKTSYREVDNFIRSIFLKEYSYEIDEAVELVCEGVDEDTQLPYYNGESVLLGVFNLLSDYKACEYILQLMEDMYHYAMDSFGISNLVLITKNYAKIRSAFNRMKEYSYKKLSDFVDTHFETIVNTFGINFSNSSELVNEICKGE